jgi:hypothetical protein
LDPRHTAINQLPYVLGHPSSGARVYQGVTFLPFIDYLYHYPQLWLNPEERGIFRPFITAIFYKQVIWKPYLEELSELDELGVGFAHVLRQFRNLEPEDAIDDIKEDLIWNLQFHELDIVRLETICNFPWSRIKPHYSLFEATAIWIGQHRWYNYIKGFLSALGHPSLDTITRWKRFIVQYRAARAAAKAQARQYLLNFVFAKTRRRVDKKSLLGMLKYCQATGTL